MSLPPLDDPRWRELARAVAEAHHAALVRRWRQAQFEQAAADVDDAIARLRAKEAELFAATSGDAARSVPSTLPRTIGGETLH